MRIKALNTLYQFPLSDELTSKNSEGIRKGLLSALADDDEQLAVSQHLVILGNVYIQSGTSLGQNYKDNVLSPQLESNSEPVVPHTSWILSV